MDINDNNIKAKDESLAMCQDIQEIVKPIFSLLNVHGFSLHRIYKNDERIFFANTTQWIENYFQKNYLVIQGYQKFLTAPSYLLWAQWPKEDDKVQQLIHDAYINFNMGHALAINRVHKEYIDSFVLRGYAQDADVNHRYMTYLDVIDKFLDVFLIEARDLIHKAETKKICVNTTEIESVNWLPYLFQEKGSLLKKKVLLSSEILHPTTGKPFLTQREKECIEGILKGKTAKEIARDLNISFRTVEEYLTNIKIKMNTNSKSDLINQLFTVEHNKRIFLEGIE